MIPTDIAKLDISDLQELHERLKQITEEFNGWAERVAVTEAPRQLLFKLDALARKSSDTRGYVEAMLANRNVKVLKGKHAHH